MSPVLIALGILAGWCLLAAVVAVVLGRSIANADKRDGTR